MIAPKAVLQDSGVYSCNLRNDLGQERVTIKVIVLDKPTQPQGPLEVSDVKVDGCTLAWKPPKETGGSPITNYVIEKFDVKSNEWQKVSSFCKKTSYEVIGLDEGRPYKFRVSAENEQGVSIPLETETSVVPKLPYGIIFCLIRHGTLLSFTKTSKIESFALQNSFISLLFFYFISSFYLTISRQSNKVGFINGTTLLFFLLYKFSALLFLGKVKKGALPLYYFLIY